MNNNDWPEVPAAMLVKVLKVRDSKKVQCKAEIRRSTNSKQSFESSKTYV